MPVYFVVGRRRRVTRRRIAAQRTGRFALFPSYDATVQGQRIAGAGQIT